MGAHWLHDLPDVIGAGGLNYDLYDGWEHRARSSGGYDQVWAVFVHHTASNTTPASDMNWMWSNPNNADGPVGALYLARDGLVTIGAAGATNCQGKGGPWAMSNGTIPLDKGNAYGIAIEAGNDGQGEPWPAAQQEAYLALVDALCNGYGLDVRRDVLGHFEWVQPSCPGRKVDPAGPSAWATGASSWDMDRFRADAAGAPPPDPGPDPEPEPPPTGDNWMASLPTIRKGDRGDYVERMQHLLAAAGYMNPANAANYDGVWGSGTDDAKCRFDNDHGLTPSPPTDCGPKSWESLMTGRRW